MPDIYDELKHHFRSVDGVTVNEGRGSQGIKFGKKMFVMFYKGQLLVSLPAERVDEIVAAGEGLPFDPGTGTVMKNRVLIPDTRKESWVEICEESLRLFDKK